MKEEEQKLLEIRYKQIQAERKLKQATGSIDLRNDSSNSSLIDSSDENLQLKSRKQSKMLHPDLIKNRKEPELTLEEVRDIYAIVKFF